MSAVGRFLVPEPKEFRKQLLAAAPWVAGFTVLAALLELAGWLTPFANMGEDTFGVLRAQRPPQDVVVVVIDPASYARRDLFNSAYPIAVQPLRRLIAAVAAARPRVIAVDEATTSASFRSLKPDPSWPPVVWAQEAVASVPGCVEVPACAYRALPILGGTAPSAGDPGACATGRGCAAIPIRLPDRDLIGRHYTRMIDVTGLEDRPSFPWAIVETCAATPSPDPHCVAAVDRAKYDTGEQTIQFDIPDPWPALFTAGTAIDLAESHDAAVSAAWRHDPGLRDHIVIIGGTYDQTDLHHTPGAVRAGIFVNAQIVENEIGDRAIREVPFIGLIVLDLLVGFALVYLAYRLPFKLALGASAGLVAIVFLASFLAFRTFNIWLNFIPVVVGVALHEFTDNLREYARLRAKERREHDHGDEHDEAPVLAAPPAPNIPGDAS